MGMSRHMKVCRFLEEETEAAVNKAIESGDVRDWQRLDNLHLLRDELQQLKEDNALYKVQFVKLSTGE